MHKGRIKMKKTKIETSYEALLEDVKDLSDATIKSYQQTLEALKTLDVSKALMVIRADENIDEMQQELLDNALILIVRNQPVASDLRKVLMIIKLASEYERIADYTKNISEYIILIKENDSIEHYQKNVDKFVEALDIIINMLESVMEGLLTEDRALIKKTARMDEKVDVLYHELMASLIEHIQVVDGKVFGTAHAILMNKYIERAGDHITNIAEEMLFALKGERYHLN